MGRIDTLTRFEGHMTECSRQHLRATLERLATEAKREGRALPGVREMAALAGVSRETVRRVVGRMAAQGRLDVRRGAGIWPAGTVPANDSPPQPRVSRSHEVYLAVRSSLAHESHLPDLPLPSIRELCVQLGAGHRTVAGALDRLVREGYIVRHGRGYRAARHARPLSDNRIVLIVAGDRFGNVRFPTTRALRNLLMLESECMRVGIGLAIVTVTPSGDRIHYPSGDNTVLSPTAEGVLGHVVWPSSTIGTVLRSVQPYLRRSSQPVVVIDETLVPPPDVYQALPGARLLQPLQGRAAGRQVGLMLRQMGHRGVCWFTRDPSQDWSIPRYEGLSEVFSSRGGRCSLRPVHCLPTSESSPLQGRESAAREIRSGLYDGPLKDNLVRLVTTFYDDSARLLRRARLRESLEPVFASELARANATAWVGDNDELALAALEYLERHHPRGNVPIAVVGFDDSIEAVGAGLTSYDFNGQACAAAAMNHILWPNRFRHEPNPQPIEGFVVQRRSTAVRVAISEDNRL
ncbi:MAG: GntR family transcriptional regulator [Chitinivibrionales bacterium]|nr:GntR family transcriptional regulator [Chitinivibrionales bacterium]